MNEQQAANLNTLTQILGSGASATGQIWGAQQQDAYRRSLERAQDDYNRQQERINRRSALARVLGERGGKAAALVNWRNAKMKKVKEPSSLLPTILSSGGSLLAQIGGGIGKASNG